MRRLLNRHAPGGRADSGMVVGGIVAAFLFGVSASSAEAQHGQQTCHATGALPSPPTPRPHYALSVRVLPSLRTVVGALMVTFTAPPGDGVDRLEFRGLADDAVGITGISPEVPAAVRAKVAHIAAERRAHA